MFEACIRENATRALRIGEREGAGRALRTEIRKRDVGKRRTRWHHDPIVVGKVLPAQENEAPARANRRRNVGERSHRILEKHHAESTHRQIKRRGREGVNLNVALLEAHVGEPFGACAALGLVEHRG